MRQIIDPQASRTARRLLTRHEIAARLGLHVNTLDRATKRGELPVVRIGGRRLYDWRAVAAALGIDPEGARDE
jgi:excisionase family DNA binding protein